jgi:hypothetical protein
MQTHVADGKPMEHNFFGDMTDNDLSFLSLISDENVKLGNDDSDKSELHKNDSDDLNVELDDLFTDHQDTDPDPILYDATPPEELAAQTPQPSPDEPCDLVSLQWLNENKRGGRWGVYKNDVYYAHGNLMWKYSGDDEFVIEKELKFNQTDEIDRPSYFEEPQVKLIPLVSA